MYCYTIFCFTDYVKWVFVYYLMNACKCNVIDTSSMFDFTPKFYEYGEKNISRLNVGKNSEC